MGSPLLACIDAKLESQGTQMAALCSDVETTNTKMQSANDNLAAIAASLVSINQNTDTLEALVAATTAAVNLLVNQIPADALAYNATLALLANPTVLNAPGIVYAVTASGNLTIRDNATDKIQVPSGTFFILPVPLTCASSIKLLAVLASNVTLWYKAT